MGGELGRTYVLLLSSTINCESEAKTRFAALGTFRFTVMPSSDIPAL